MKDITLIPLLEAYDFPHHILEELTQMNINTHFLADVFSIDWDDETRFPLTKEWLLEQFGEDIEFFNKFAINPT